MNTIGRNIRSLRKKAGMTQEELAEKLYTTRQTVSNYEIGKSEPDFETLSKIADVFRTETADLLSDHRRNKDHSGLGAVKIISILLIAINILGLAWGYRLTDDPRLKFILSVFCFVNFLMGVIVFRIVSKIISDEFRFLPKEGQFALNWFINFKDPSVQVPDRSKLEELGSFEPYGPRAFRGWSTMSLEELVHYIENDLHYDRSQFEVFNSPIRRIHQHSDDLDRNTKS